MTALAFAHRTEPGQRRPVVLIVDDDASERASIAAALRDSFTIVEAPGAEAAAHVEGGGIDAVVMNVRLRGADCDQTMRRIKATAGDAFLPVVLVASAGDE